MYVFACPCLEALGRMRVRDGDLSGALKEIRKAAHAAEVLWDFTEHLTRAACKGVTGSGRIGQPTVQNRAAK